MTTQRNPFKDLVIDEFITPRTTSHPLHLDTKQTIEILDLGQLNRESDFFTRIGRIRISVNWSRERLFEVVRFGLKWGGHSE